MPRTRARTPNDHLAPIQLLPPELKQHIFALAFSAPCLPLTALLGAMGLLVLSVFGNDDTSQLNTAIYTLSQGRLRCVEDIRHTSHAMYKLLNPHHATSMAIGYLDSLFSRLDDLEIFLRRYGHILPREEFPLKPKYALDGWRSAKIVIYAGPRGKPHTDKHVFGGILHAFGFHNDILHPLGIDQDNVTRITYRVNMPLTFLTYHKYDSLLSNRDMGVFAAVVNVTSGRVHDDQGDSFSYLSPVTCSHRNQQAFISRSPFMKEHLCDVWREWPEQD